MEKRKLTYKQLKDVNGGRWDDSTLTDDEWYNLHALHTDWYLAKRPEIKEAAKAALFAYVAELETKYGPSGWTEDEWLIT